MSQFKVGDVVRLKSGSPKMTVSQVQSNGAVCSWFAGSENKVGHFPFDSLEKVVEQPRPVGGGSSAPHTAWS
jgi:uncharacterized protein YodC (DUF2158 family)